MDMLSIRKIKLHGMKDDKWKTRDKVSQYKGLINLYKRDQKISNSDKYVSLKKTKTQLCRLKRKITLTYEDLDNAIFGDKQKIRNVLIAERRIQLAYQHLEPEVIIEHIHQQNFTARKQLDLIQYCKLQKARNLVSAKLETAVMEDRLKFERLDDFPVEIKSKIFTACVQDANLKKEAAIVVNGTYKKIISVMKKDQIYFDQILFTLRQDSKKQAKCMYDTIILGQLAIEYLDDRKQEYQMLENAVQTDMRIRKKTVEATRDLVTSLSKNIKFFIRRDSDLNLPQFAEKLPYTADLQGDLSEVTTVLDQFKNTFLVNNYMQLFECVLGQSNQHERLRNLYKKNLLGRDQLQNKMNHVTTMHTQLYNTMLESTVDYKEEKSKTLEEIEELEHKIEDARVENQKCLKVINKVRISLQQMEQMCKLIKDSKRVDPEQPVVAFLHPDQTKEDRKRLHKNVLLRKVLDEEDALKEGMKDTIDIKQSCVDIIDILERKLKSLMTSAEPIADDRQRSTADNYMQHLAQNRKMSIITEGPIQVDSLLLDVVWEEVGVPSRQEIKTLSRNTVIAFTTTEDDLLPPAPKPQVYTSTKKAKK